MHTHTLNPAHMHMIGAAHAHTHVPTAHVQCPLPAAKRRNMEKRMKGSIEDNTWALSQDIISSWLCSQEGGGHCITVSLMTPGSWMPDCMGV